MITGYIIEKCEDGTSNWLRCNARLCPDLYYRVCRRNRYLKNSLHLALSGLANLCVLALF